MPALGHRNFRLYIGAQAVSLIGTWMQNLGQAWLILLLTGDPFALGLVTAVQGLPIVGLGLVGGVIADRFSKRRVLVATQLAMMALATVLAVLCLAEAVAASQVVLLALALGVAKAIDMPARAAFAVEMVGPAELASAVALNSTAYHAARLVGPAMAGVAISSATGALGDPIRGVGVAFLIDAVTYVAMVVALVRMRESDLVRQEPDRARRGIRSIAHEIGEGLSYVRGSRRVRVTLVVPGLIATIAVNFIVLVPVLAQELELDAGGLGLLMSALGVGALASAARISFGGPAGPRVLVGGALVLGLAELLVGVAPSAPLLAILLFAAGAGSVAMRTAANTLIQLATPGYLRGRVMSVFAIVFEGSSPLGGIVAGAIAAALGGQAAFVAVGLVATALALAGARALLRTAEARPS